MRLTMVSLLLLVLFASNPAVTSFRPMHFSGLSNDNHRENHHLLIPSRKHDNAGLVAVKMGGYYSEPNDTKDQSNTHMLYGVRCEEYTIFCSLTTSIVNLRPIEGDDKFRETDTDQLAQQHLVKYLFTPDEGDDAYSKPVLKDKRIVQIGCGGTALACAQFSGASNVLVVDADETRLKMYQHAFDNFNNATNTSCPLETMVLEPKDALPKADVIVLSTQDEEWINAALETDRTRTCLFEGAY